MLLGQDAEAEVPPKKTPLSEGARRVGSGGRRAGRPLPSRARRPRP